MAQIFDNNIIQYFDENMAQRKIRPKNPNFNASYRPKIQILIHAVVNNIKFDAL